MADGKITWCNICPMPSAPDPVAHPAGQVEHVDVGERPASRVSIGANTPAGMIVITRYAPSAVVEETPDESFVSLGLIQSTDPWHLTVSGDRLYLGTDRAGAEVVYQVVGWDAEQQSLRVRRVAP